MAGEGGDGQLRCVVRDVPPDPAPPSLLKILYPPLDHFHLSGIRRRWIVGVVGGHLMNGPGKIERSSKVTIRAVVELAPSSQIADVGRY
jgi:hypothetical protein